MTTTPIPSQPPAAGGYDFSSAGTNDTEDSALGSLDYNAFLQLLVAQLQNQDPTKPLDSTEYLGQLASYANVEQNIRANAKLDEVMASVQASNAAALIGRSVSSPDGAVGGVVQGYETRGGGVMLLLDNGARLPMGPDLRVEEQAP